MLPDDLAFYSFQIAGHHYSKQKSENFGVLLCKKTNRLLKPLQSPPRGPTEVQFYENVWNGRAIESKDPDASIFIRLKDFVPRFYGTRKISCSGNKGEFIELENLTVSFQKPCVVDIKIGSRTWDPLASKEKIEYEKSKYPYAEKLGFRFLGCMIYRDNVSLYEFRDKDWGKNLNEDEIITALKFIFPHERETCEILVICVLRKLHRILTFFQGQRRFTFYSSSILISYEGCRLNSGIREILKSDAGQAAVLLNAFKQRLKNKTSMSDTELFTFPDDDAFFSSFDAFFNLKMIDFTHVFEEAGQIDDNYLTGLKSFIKFVTKYLDSLTA